jgi:hypothetical protein
MPEDISDSVARYRSLLSTADEQLGQIKTWTLSSAPQGMQELSGIVASLASLHAAMKERLVEKSEAASAKRKKALLDSSNESKARNVALKLFKEYESPENLLRFLHERSALFAVGQRGQQPGQPSGRTLVRRVTNDASSGSTASEQGNCKVQTKDDDVWASEEPTYFPAGEGDVSVASKFCALPER